MKCAYCGEEFQPKNKQQKYDKPGCGRLADRDRKRERKASGKGKYEFVCKGCGVTYHTDYKNRDQYCSRECAYKHRPATRVTKPRPCIQCGESYLVTEGYSYEFCSEACRNLAFTQTCSACGVVFVGAIHNQNTCGDDECYKEYERRRHSERSRRLHAELAPVYTCKVCGYDFSPVYGSKARRFCSDQCREIGKRRFHHRNAIARARHFGVYYEHFSKHSILKRDNWTCYICGAHTPKELRGTFEDNAPEIDHVIPLSKGGPHTPDNVRCCCRRCNGAKRDRTLREMRRAALVPLFAEAGS